MAAYTNFFGARDGSIICYENEKLQDRSDPRDRIQWSDIIFQAFEQEAIRKHQPITSLRTIWRFHVVNSTTRKIVGEANTLGAPKVGPYFIEHSPSGSRDRGFFALLGCPNGSGIVRMLADHCVGLGMKTIESVRILKSGDPLIMYFVLASHEPTPSMKRPQKSVAGQRRAAERQKRERPGGAQDSSTLANT
ncbi:MAG: hypothetical protein Q9182_004283 [Xanthomendoza sp. 2 TL-2023]